MKEKTSKKDKAALMKNLAIISVPVIAMICVVIALALAGKGSKAANLELEEKLAEGGTLNVLEIVPDKCQAQFSWLVKGQEPIGKIQWVTGEDGKVYASPIGPMYSDDPAQRAKLDEFETDLNNYASVFKQPDGTWYNANDFLWYVFDGYVESNTGAYAYIEAKGIYVEFVSETDASGAVTYRYKKVDDYNYTPDPKGNYVKYNLATGVDYGEVKLLKDGTDIVRYERSTKLDERQITFTVVTPAELDAAIANDRDYLLQYDLICIEKGSYGHLEKITAKINGGNPSATYQTDDFKWATIEALYEYAGKLEKPLMMDSSLSGSASTNLKRFYLMVRVMPYKTFKPIYDLIDHETGALNAKYTCEDPYNLGHTPPQMSTYDLTWDLSSIINHYLHNRGKKWADISTSMNDLKDADGEYELYLMTSNSMDNLSNNIFLFKGEDITLGNNFKLGFFGEDRTKFTEVVDELIEIENVQDVTNASVLKYLLNLNSAAALRHQISILEVEPDVYYKYATTNLPAFNTDLGKVVTFTKNNEQVRELLISMGYLPTKNSISNVNVVTMTSAAFANFKGDLTNFEYIYIGSGQRTGTPREGEYKTTLLYKFVEPTLFRDEYGRLKGMNQYTSGNDITTWIKDGIINYAKAGKVLSFGDALYDLDVNVIQAASVMYEAAAGAKAVSSTTVVKESDSTALARAFRNASDTPQIIFAQNGHPVKYYDANREGNKYATVEKNSEGIYRYNFKFTVKGTSGKSYRAYVYLDANGDGRFVESADSSNETELVITSTAKVAEGKDGITESFSIGFDIPSHFSGILPWKLAVVEMDSNGKPTKNLVSEIGYSVCPPAKKKVVNVLQIMPDVSKGQTYGTFNLVNVKDSLVPMRTVSYESQFRNLLADNVEDYDIRIYGITLSEFSKLYTDDGASRKFYVWNSTKDKLIIENITCSKFDQTSETTIATTDLLSDKFDMVIMGFGDTYNSTGTTHDTTWVDNLYYFATTGHSMLLAHDVIHTYIGPILPEDTVNREAERGWNRQFSLKFRDLAGMDRFGYNATQGTISYGDEKSVTCTFDSDNYSNMDKLNALGLMRASFGYNSIYLMKANLEQDGVDSRLWNGYTFTGSGSNATVNKVTKSNTGPITEYPFHLSETIDVSPTHSQFLQLNLEDQDLIVWYNLAGQCEGEAYETGNNYHNYTFNDAWNNFYAYTNGSITYTGAGHNYNESTPPSQGEMELFINTIVAALKVGNKAPEVTVTNAIDCPSDDADYLMFIGEKDPNTEVRFIVEDSDLIQDAPIRNVKIYWNRDRTAGNEGYVEGSSDVLLYEFTNTVLNANTISGINNQMLLTGEDTVNGNYAGKKFLTSNGVTNTTLFDTNLKAGNANDNRDVISTLISQIGDSDRFGQQSDSDGAPCVYINITATDAKGLSDTVVIKVRIMELYNLE